MNCGAGRQLNIFFNHGCCNASHSTRSLYDVTLTFHFEGYPSPPCESRDLCGSLSQYTMVEGMPCDS